jgi:hypothetical protein
MAVVIPVNDELDPTLPLLYPAPGAEPPAPTVAVYVLAVDKVVVPIINPPAPPPPAPEN